MKRKSPRYLGMTGMQIGILAGLSFVALLSIAGAGWLILSMSISPGVAAVPAPIATQISATASPTKPVTVELTSTVTPTVTPTAAVAATAVPPEGWVEFKTRGAHIWLPNSFVGGDILDHRSETIKAINKLGKYYANVVKGLKTLPKEFVLWMVDKNLTQTGVITTVSVEHLVSTEDISIDQYIQDFMSSSVNGTPIAMSVIINGTKKMTLLGREARRLTYTQRLSGLEITGLLYYIKDGTDFWKIDYSLSPNDYFTMLPIVEQSIDTFFLEK